MPRLVVSKMTKTLRPGKVLLDWSQNTAAKTTIAPYSLRGRDTPCVAAPRTWAELGEAGELHQLRFEEVIDRAATEKDPLAGVFSTGPRVPD
jgi:bifunctional non-homologous end joining protein LigD